MAQYVLLDPTGNVTALVTEWGGGREERKITQALMRESEQVAYLEAPGSPGAVARVRLMGGEFCGNATMAAAGWLVRDQLRPGREMTVPLEVSGAKGVLFCRVRGLQMHPECPEIETFEGTVDMPGVKAIWEEKDLDEPLTAVRMEGILHLIREHRTPLEKERAEALLKKFAFWAQDDAVGLMDWNPETGVMTPLVFVRGSGTTVWETACGSGSAAIGAMTAWRKGTGRAEIQVKQPGGTIRVCAEAENKTVTGITITGTVRIGEEKELNDTDGPPPAIRRKDAPR